MVERNKFKLLKINNEYSNTLKLLKLYNGATLMETPNLSKFPN